jgi:hypothetical protein
VFATGAVQSTVIHAKICDLVNSADLSDANSSGAAGSWLAIEVQAWARTWKVKIRSSGSTRQKPLLGPWFLKARRDGGT